MIKFEASKIAYVVGQVSRPGRGHLRQRVGGRRARALMGQVSRPGRDYEQHYTLARLLVLAFSREVIRGKMLLLSNELVSSKYSNCS